jgi:hypothetical protein
MLPVPHQACTLATGALRSISTMIVKPSGKVHFCAVTGGKVIAAGVVTVSLWSRSLLNIAINVERAAPPFRS